jgi:acetyl-CoA carboxylase biotin carboxyl carrier protein
MMDFKSIQELLRMVNKSDLTEVEIEQKDFKIKITRQLPEMQTFVQPNYYPSPAALPPTAPAPGSLSYPGYPTSSPEPKKDSAGDTPETTTGLFEFRSPIIGTFYRSNGPDKEPFVKVGDTINPGQPLCIIEAMKLFNEIESDISGKVVKILIENAQPVEYDQPLFLIELAK